MSSPETYLDKAGDTLDAARVLLDTAHYTDCVSRAYYVMFYAATAALLDEGIMTKTHRGTHTQFNKQFIKSEVLPRQMGRSLRKAFELRQAVDYEPDVRISREVAEHVLVDAAAFLDEVVSLIQA